ncbi:hypothetical protein [Nocardia seriolae]|uniref:hypothetical protein n=1 Tax=Nocardia seriolae TaxID=37332 RepID=UPI001319EAF0|nr:hypothetical protein [Nocardia seriolae]
MDLAQARADWLRQGFVMLPGHLPSEVLGPAVAELGTMFPTAAGFHDGSDPRRERFLGDEFAGIDVFPFEGTEVSLLPVHDLLTDLARTLLGSADIRLYGADAWAKYTGAADYDQDLHRDYLNHTVLVPSSAPEYRQVEMFVFLADVPEDRGPPHLVPRAITAGARATPNWFPAKGSPQQDRFTATGNPEWYEHEKSAAGPAGTVTAFEFGTFHRGTAMTPPRRSAIHTAPELSASRRRMGPARRLGESQPRSRLVPLRGPRHTTPTRTGRLPTTGPPLLDPRNIDGPRPPLSRARHNPVVVKPPLSRWSRP